MARQRKIVKKNTTKDQKVTLIYVEGETEENYLKYVKSLFNKSMKIRIEKKSKIANVKHFVDKTLSDYSISKYELILVYDLEKSVVEYNKFIKNGKLIHDSTYLTQPCIEIHFLYHDESGRKIQPNTNMSASQAEERLLKILPKYKKGTSFCWEKNGIELSHIQNAIELSNAKFNGFDDNVFSMIGMLLENHILPK